MEQAAAGYWMWSHNKRKHNDLNTASWEEQAFAEDAAGALGGCVWPPRSYSCSFCRRDFRSAQALGGHMNVHRRDRARLKQSSSSSSSSLSPPNEIFRHFDHHHHHHHHQSLTTFQQYPSRHFDHHQQQQLQTIVCTPKPNSPPPYSTSGVSDSLLSVNHHHQPNITRNKSKPSSWSNLMDEKNNSSRVSVEPASSGYKADYVETDLSVSLNLVVRRTGSSALSSSDHHGNEKEEATSISFNKRRRVPTEASTATIPFFLMKPCSTIDDDLDHDHQSEEDQEHKTVFDIPATSIGGLDLELRLGESAKVIK